MLRAISDIAVAINVRSVTEKLSRPASSRPRCRAMTMSWSFAMGTTISSTTEVGPLGQLVEERQSLLEIEGGVDLLKGEAKLHHRERHFRLYAHDHRGSSTQPSHVRDASQRSCCE